MRGLRSISAKEIFTFDRTDLDVRKRPYTRRANGRIENAHLTEEVALFENRENHLTTVGSDANDCDRARNDQIKRLARVALTKDHLVLDETTRHDELGDFGELYVVEVAKERNRA